MASDEPQISGLAGRYATALFELAQEERAVETVERDFAALKTLVNESPDLRLLVRAPVFSRKDQEKGMDAVLRRMEAAPARKNQAAVCPPKKTNTLISRVVIPRKVRCKSG